MPDSSPHSERGPVITLRSAAEHLSSRLTLEPNPVELENAADLLLYLVEQLETLRRHDEAATQDAVTFRKRMVQLEEAIRHELGVTHGDDTIRRLRAALDAPYPAKERDPALCRHGYDLTQEAECPLCKAQEALSEWEPARWCRRCGVYGCEHVLPAQSPAIEPEAS